MNPDINLEEQLYLAASINTILEARRLDGAFTADQRADIIAKCLRLTELIEALDHWITGGGVLPDRWVRIN